MYNWEFEDDIFNSEREHFFSCPYCGAEISMLIDLSAGSQQYIEDCEVCCRPIEVRYTVREGELDLFDARMS